MCGCNKRAGRSTQGMRAGLTTTNKTSRTLSALNSNNVRNAGIAPQSAKVIGAQAEKRRVQAARRNAIIKSLNRSS